jgi:hypothetical protein
MFSFEYEPGAGVLRAQCRGFWTVEEADDYCDRLETEAAAARRSSGRLRLMVDIVDNGVHSGAVMQSLFRAKEIAIRTPADRVAVVQRASLGRLQSGRVIRTGQTRVFDSEAAALGWLAEPTDCASPLAVASA